MAEIRRAKRRQTKSYPTEAGERNAKPPPWKKMITGRDVDLGAVGTKSLNQRLRFESTMTSEDLTPLTGFGFGKVLRSRKFMIWRLTVPLERREASETMERSISVIRVFHGSTGFGVCDVPVAAAAIVVGLCKKVVTR